MRGLTSTALMGVVAVVAVFAAESGYTLLCRGDSCEAELKTTVDEGLSMTNITTNVLVGGYAIPTGVNGDTATFQHQTRKFTPKNVVVSTKITDTRTVVVSQPPIIATHCFCSFDAAPCGPAGIQRISMHEAVIVWYSQAHTDIGCPVAENARLCTKIRLVASSSYLMHSISGTIGSVTLVNGTNATEGAEPFRHLQAMLPPAGGNAPIGNPNTDRFEIYRTIWTSTGEHSRLQLTSDALDTSLSHYYYVETATGIQKAFVRASDETLNGAMWWSCNEDGTCQIPTIGEFAAMFEVGDYDMCNAEVPSTLPITNGEFALTAADGVRIRGKSIDFDHHSGTVGIRIEETATLGFPVDTVTRIDCIWQGTSKVVQLTTPIPKYGYAVLTSPTSEKAIPVKLAGTVTAYTPEGNPASFSANVGVNKHTCVWAVSRLLSVIPLDEFQRPIGSAPEPVRMVVPSQAPPPDAKIPGWGIAIIVGVVVCMVITLYAWQRHRILAGYSSFKEAMCRMTGRCPPGATAPTVSGKNGGAIKPQASRAWMFGRGGQTADE